VQYTAIIKDGGLFIPNVFSDLNDGHSYIVQVEVDIEEARKQLSASEEPKKQAAKRPLKKPVKKEPQAVDLGTIRKSAVDELAALDDAELSEMLKAYMNDGQVPTQISLENL
jgi:hypothetical protein